MHFLLMQPLKKPCLQYTKDEARLFKNYMEMCGTEQQNDGHQFNQSLQKNIPIGAT